MGKHRLHISVRVCREIWRLEQLTLARNEARAGRSWFLALRLLRKERETNPRLAEIHAEELRGVACGRVFCWEGGR